MTETVYWPKEEAHTQNGKVETTIVSWDYEAKRGTAMLEGGKIVEVRQVTVLTVVERTN